MSTKRPSVITTEDTGKAARPTFVREGTKVIMPDTMSHAELRKWSEQVEKDEETTTAVVETFECFPLDGANACKQAIDEIFGFSTGADGFWKSDALLSVRTGPNPTDIIQVPWGDFAVPALGKGGEIQITSNPRSRIPSLQVALTLQRKNRALASKFIARVRELIRDRSIYQGKAIRPTFKYIDEDRPFHILNDAPSFVDLSGIDRSRIVYSGPTGQALEVSLFTPITKSDLCRAYGIPLKRSVLLTGPYGTGKTLTARAAALECTRHGWAFIHCEDSNHLADAYRLASKLQPAMVFCEDIDSQIPEGARTDKLNEILNVVDGVEHKSDEIFLLMTTNHLDKIHSAMLRPGRIDTLVEITAPDAKAAVDLVRLYADGLLDPAVPLDPVGDTLAGNIPAVIAETVKHAKLTALARTDNITGQVQPRDIVDTARMMRNHVALLAPKPVLNPQVEVVQQAISIAEAGALTALNRILNSPSAASLEP